MDYFRLGQDRRIPYSVLLQGTPDIPNIQNAMHGDIVGLEEMTIVTVSSSTFNAYPNILDRQLFLVKEEIKEVFTYFAPQMQYRSFCLLDTENAVFNYYFAPDIELVYCFDESSTYNLNKSVIQKVVLKKEQVKDRDIFRLKEVNDCVVIVSLPVAESLMRRKIEGLRFFSVELTTENGGMQHVEQ